jgi:hypothetical protein
MAGTIDIYKVKQYGDTLQQLVQLMGNKFKGKCREEGITGEERYFDQLGSTTATERTDIFGDSPEDTITKDRRKVIATPYHNGLWLDTIEKVQTLVDPRGQYVQNQNYALNRMRDIEFFKGALGTALTGKAGATSVTFDNCPAVGIDVGGTGNQGMNLDKLRATLEALEVSGVDVENPNDKPYFVWSPKQKNELLANTEPTSSDYNTVKTLVNGQINSFYGFEFITHNLLPYAKTGAALPELTWSTTAGEDNKPVDTDATDIRMCFAYTKNSIIQATNPEIVTEIEKRGDKSFNWYAYSMIRTGAVRMEEKRVVAVPCDESP